MSHDLNSWIDQVSRSGAPTAHYFKAQPLFIARPELLATVCRSLTWEDGCRLLNAAAQEQLVPSEAFQAVQRVMVNTATKWSKPVSSRAALGLLPLWATHQVTHARENAAGGVRHGDDGRSSGNGGVVDATAAVCHLPPAAFVNAARTVAESPLPSSPPPSQHINGGDGRWLAALKVVQAADIAGLTTRPLLLYTALACAKSAASVQVQHNHATKALPNVAARRGALGDGNKAWFSALRCLQAAVALDSSSSAGAGEWHSNGIAATGSVSSSNEKRRRRGSSTPRLVSSAAAITAPPHVFHTTLSSVLAVTPMSERPRILNRLRRLNIVSANTSSALLAAPSLSSSLPPTSLPETAEKHLQQGVANMGEEQEEEAGDHYHPQEKRHHEGSGHNVHPFDIYHPDPRRVLLRLMSAAEAGRVDLVLSVLLLDDGRPHPDEIKEETQTKDEYEERGDGGDYAMKRNRKRRHSINMGLINALVAAEKSSHKEERLLSKVVSAVIRSLLAASTSSSSFPHNTAAAATNSTFGGGARGNADEAFTSSSSSSCDSSSSPPPPPLPQEYIVPFLQSLVAVAEREAANAAFLAGEEVQPNEMGMAVGSDGCDGATAAAENMNTVALRSAGFFRLPGESLRAVTALLRTHHTPPSSIYSTKETIDAGDNSGSKATTTTLTYNWKHSLALLTALGTVSPVARDTDIMGNDVSSPSATNSLSHNNRHYHGGRQAQLLSPSSTLRDEAVLRREMRQNFAWLDRAVLTDLILMCSQQGCPRAGLHLIGATRRHLDVSLPSEIPIPLPPVDPTTGTGTAGADGFVGGPTTAEVESRRHQQQPPPAAAPIPAVNPGSVIEALLFCQAYRRWGEACGIMGRLLPSPRTRTQTERRGNGNHQAKTNQNQLSSSHSSSGMSSSVTDTDDSDAYVGRTDDDSDSVDYDALHRAAENMAPAVVVAWNTARECGRTAEMLEVFRRATGGGFPLSSSSSAPSNRNRLNEF